MAESDDPEVCLAFFRNSTRWSFSGKRRSFLFALVGKRTLPRKLRVWQPQQRPPGCLHMTTFEVFLTMKREVPSTTFLPTVLHTLRDQPMQDISCYDLPKFLVTERFSW